MIIVIIKQHNYVILKETRLTIHLIVARTQWGEFPLTFLGASWSSTELKKNTDQWFCLSISKQ